MLDFLERNKDITDLSNFKTPAKADYYFEIHTIDQLDQLKSVFKWIQEENINYLIVWGGTNMLFAFDNYEGIIIKNNLLWWFYTEESQILESYSAESIWDIAQILETDDNQGLWHRFIWLPGSIWGAVYGNAWCFGLEIENNFIEAFVLDIFTWETKFLSKSEMEFSYRSSILKTSIQYFLLKVKFDLSKKIEKYHSDVDNIYFREYKQPKGNTCGSFFKNPNREKSAWKLIEEVWLKWYKLWWAYFSGLHANFLMNDWSWAYTDLLSLIKLAEDKVKQNFWIELVNEVRIISNK
jgi:UDP-N-acetylmuramate dehydrogenase